MKISLEKKLSARSNFSIIIQDADLTIYSNIRHDIINEKIKMISKNAPNTMTTFENQMIIQYIIMFCSNAKLK